MHFKQLQGRFSGWSPRDSFSTVLLLFLFFLRGLWQRVYFGSARGLVLIGRGVSIRYGRHLFAGKDLIIEDYAEVNCQASKRMIFGDRVTIGRFAIIRPSNSYGGPIGEGLKVGNNSSIGAYNYIGCSGFISIGSDVMLGPRVGLFAENHVFDRTDVTIKEQGVFKKYITIEDDCWIGTNSVILAGVTIGKGSVVAAGSVVTKNVPPYSVVGGIPAVVIKLRKDL